MIKTIIFYLGVILSLISTLFSAIKVKFLSEDNRKKYIHKRTANWAKFVMKISGAKITVSGLDNIPQNETLLFVSNHQSYFDIPLLMSTIDVPKGFIAKKELEKWPIVRLWMRYLKCIFMDRENVRKSAEAIVEGINILKSGYSMVIFPEGTRCQGGKHQDFKAGSFKLATKSKVSIVPISINGTNKLLEGNDNRLKAANITVTVHPIVDVKNLSKEELAVLPETVEKTIFSVIE
jgi:1-acyl-sn-glycerol-3-phosphate acyltransferase